MGWRTALTAVLSFLCSIEQSRFLFKVAVCHRPARLQVCVWKLGAPTASMFFGLRLVFSVVLSTPILGSTIIKTGVQVRIACVQRVDAMLEARSHCWTKTCSLFDLPVLSADRWGGHHGVGSDSICRFAVVVGQAQCARA